MSGSYFVLAEFVMAALLHGAAVAQILMIFLTEARKKLSVFLLALLSNWLCAALFLLPYEAYAIIVWRPVQGVQYNGNTLYLIAMPAHLLLASIPVCVFFLTVDRICIIRLGHHYGHTVKRVLTICFVCTLVCGTMVNLIGILSAMPVQAETECEIFGCILGTSVQYYLCWRAFCAVFNTASGVIFFVVFYRSYHKMAKTTNVMMMNTAGQQHMRRANRANNVLTSIAIISELFLSFLPHFVPFIWEKLFGAGSSLGTGPLSELMSSVEVLLFSTIYAQMFSARDDKSPHGSAATNAMALAAVANNNNLNNNGRRRSDRVGPAWVPSPNHALQQMEMPRVGVPDQQNCPRTSMAQI